MRKVETRLLNVKSLSTILPDGTEGGKEFARVIDLLLFHEARRNNKKITIFDDSAGDYNGLDSFEGDMFRNEGTIGYQYKFFASPLTNKHRESIRESLKKSAFGDGFTKLKKWILITPDDLTESATKKDGGDVTWFENLRSELKLQFEIEHWGHKKLLSLFLDTPSLCLFYYPELVTEGAKIRKSISEVKLKYDDNLLIQNRSIEFVGMSIYKPEATKGIPMEHIYIPLNLIPEAVIDESSNNISINPIDLLSPGTKSVILGDPGSGKSTLLKFLSLSGISKPLQERYETKSDDRLPIFITLRRYADELKSRQNLPLIDFIKEVIQCDFSLRSVDFDFLEYYLDNGNAILLFDGLDELPDPYFKEIVRNRIMSFNTSYPGNTCLISSRIVGYDNPYRFDEKKYSHYKLAKLKQPEMEQFVKDWYNVRIESEKDRDANVNDLIRILREEDSIAIRELAENPLLLTIVTLVHRIDAVLPDERVVLYQKCTETLLNTWQTWKFKDIETKNRGKIDKRNKRRMEAIAHWMQEQSVGVEKQQRSIVHYEDILNFLIKHIKEVEKYNEIDNDPEELAKDFLEFIKKRAGLLIELGDGKYSFVHLTFQEYLTSSDIITNSEKDGVAKIWSKLHTKVQDARWYEVIRLLVAGLKSEESQEFIVNQIILENNDLSDAKITQLLGGFLLDGVSAAEIRREEILRFLIECGINVKSLEGIRSINATVKILLTKDTVNKDMLLKVFEKLWTKEKKSEQKRRLGLFALSSDAFIDISHLVKCYISQKDSSIYLKLFFGNGFETVYHNKELGEAMTAFKDVQKYFTIKSAYGNFISAALQSINFSYNLLFGFKMIFDQYLITLSVGTSSGPNSHFFNNLINIYFVDRARTNKYFMCMPDMLKSPENKIDQIKKIDDFVAKVITGNMNMKNVEVKSFFDERIVQIQRKLKNSARIEKSIDPMILTEDLQDVMNFREEPNIWKLFLNTPNFHKFYLNVLIKSFKLRPYDLWFEALRNTYLQIIPSQLTIFDEKLFIKIEENISNGNLTNLELMFIAINLLLDSWLIMYGHEPLIKRDTIKSLIENTDEYKLPELKIAKVIWKIINEGIDNKDFQTMVNSKDFNDIFKENFWLPDEALK